ncbi:MAG: hypothetical protein NTY19_17015 [Planctomycetota bacterium]|nr:hypothetical protein [Planctomycetota bacterium]
MQKLGHSSVAPRLACCLLALLSSPEILPGQTPSLTLNGIFTENMVLQRDADVPIYGTADEGEKVTVDFNGQTAATVAKDGKWKVSLKAMKAGGPFTMTVRGKNTLEFKNILLGDVWLCTGQSNMDPLGGFNREFKEMYKEIPGEKNPNIRYFKVKVDCADEPRTEVVPASAANEPYCSPHTPCADFRTRSVPFTILATLIDSPVLKEYRELARRKKGEMNHVDRAGGVGLLNVYREITVIGPPQRTN